MKSILLVLVLLTVTGCGRSLADELVPCGGTWCQPGDQAVTQIDNHIRIGAEVWLNSDFQDKILPIKFPPGRTLTKLQGTQAFKAFPKPGSISDCSDSQILFIIGTESVPYAFNYKSSGDHFIDIDVPTNLGGGNGELRIQSVGSCKINFEVQMTGITTP